MASVGGLVSRHVSIIRTGSCRSFIPDSFSHLFQLNALSFFAQREWPIHFHELPVSTVLTQRFCKNYQTRVFFRLGAIHFYLRLHRRNFAEITVEVETAVPTVRLKDATTAGAAFGDTVIGGNWPSC